MSIDDKTGNDGIGGFRGFMQNHPRLQIGTVTLATLLTLMGGAAGCGSSGGGSESNAPAQDNTNLPGDPTPGEGYIFDFEKAANLDPFYTQQVLYPQGGDAINVPLSYGVNIADSFSVSMNESTFGALYMADQGFADRIRDIYRPIMQALNTNLTATEADQKVDNLVNSLTNGTKTDLDNDYDQVVFFGYVPDGSGGQKAYLGLSIVDENGNKKIVVAVGSDMNAQGSANVNNVDDLVDYTLQNYGAPPAP